MDAIARSFAESAKRALGAGLSSLSTARRQPRVQHKFQSDLTDTDKMATEHTFDNPANVSKQVGSLIGAPSTESNRVERSGFVDTNPDSVLKAPAPRQSRLSP